MLERAIIAVFRFFSHLGGLGLVGLGILDSSFLFMPLGNDLLVIAFTAQHPHRLPYYVAMATLGSVLGSLITDATSRKLGEAGLNDRVPKHRLDRVRKQFEKRAAWTLILASLMPPPFPFTVILMVASALQYSRRRILSSVAAGRALRFTIIGLLAVFYGRQIIQLSKQPAVRYAIIALAIISIVGSAFSIWKAFRGGKGKPASDENSAKGFSGALEEPNPE